MNFIMKLLLSILPLVINANFITNSWTRAVKQTLYEQEVEDVNAIHRFEEHLVRQLIVLPLTEEFNPNQANPMHGKLQHGDKCSLPSSIGSVIFDKPYEVPWIFEMKKITPYIKSNIIPTVSSEQNSTSNFTNLTILKKVYISPLDFRSPENYIFVPSWIMKSLNLKSNDIVEISFVRIKLAGLVVFQPLTLEWDQLMEKHSNPNLLLEREINKYSSLTAGSIITIEVDGKEYPLKVKDTKGEDKVSIHGVRVQDSDVSTDIDRSYLENLIKLKEQTEQQSSTDNKNKKN